MSEDYHDFVEPEIEDRDIEKVKPEIEDIVTQHKVVTDREVKVRLESKFFPWVTQRALVALERGGLLKKVGYPGGKAKGSPDAYYLLSGTQQSDVMGVMALTMLLSLTV